MHTIRLTPLEEDTGTRLDSFLSRRVEGLTRSAAARLLAEGCVTCDGAVPGKSYRIAGGEELCVTLPEAEEPEAVPQDIPLDVVYEDEDVIVVNKPVGMVVHPAPGHPDGTLVNALLHHCGDSLSGIGGEKRPGIVHRIDRDTSGLIIAAKNDAAHLALAAQLADHTLARTYECLAVGNFRQDSGTVDAPIGRSRSDRKKMAVVAGGRPAITHWEVLARYPGVTHLDEDVIVVNKPVGMVVHPAPGHPDGTLVNALLHHCGDSLSGIGGEKRPGIVHRIDRDTSGLIIAAKNDAAHLALAAQLADHTLARTYECLAVGNFRQDSGTVDAPIGRSRSDRKKMAVVAGGRPAITHWEVLARYPGVTHLRCRLETGRTHQIRVHLAYIGHPILGDTVYGNRKPVPGLTGQCLHATGLRFLHPRTGRPVELTCPRPEEFERMLVKLQKRI